MPLNQEYGEILAKYGPNHVVVPVQKWMNTPMFDEAVISAIGKFARKVKGVTRFDPTEIVAQEYPADGRLVFLFHKRINGVDFYVTESMLFPADQLRELVVQGYWQSWDGPRKTLLH